MKQTLLELSRRSSTAFAVQLGLGLAVCLGLYLAPLSGLTGGMPVSAYHRWALPLGAAWCALALGLLRLFPAAVNTWRCVTLGLVLACLCGQIAFLSHARPPDHVIDLAAVFVWMPVVGAGLFYLLPRAAALRLWMAAYAFQIVVGLAQLRGGVPEPAAEQIWLVGLAAQPLMFALALSVTLYHERRDVALRASEALRHMAYLDPLTGLYNRRFALDRMERLRRRSDDTLSVWIFDLDHFKRLNDTHGHGAGDEVLRDIAREVREALRRDDFAVRWGGEEFIVVMPHTGLAGALEAAERFRTTVQDRRWTGERLEVTISIGVTEGKTGETLEALIARADKALYAAKFGGRNRTEVCPAVQGDGSEPAPPRSAAARPASPALQATLDGAPALGVESGFFQPPAPRMAAAVRQEEDDASAVLRIAGVPEPSEELMQRVNSYLAGLSRNRPGARERPEQSTPETRPG